MSRIGMYAKRGSKWHLIESEIEEAVVTRCGRRMEPQDAHGNAVLVGQWVPPYEDRCAYCRGEQ